ncbi:hypothetical protein AMATHDRAFT_134800 [Amanita thiersii Skay4041]|uniref:ditrans,polycis-polyprenyl diphosphate synthase [(2E,6E)-farnesyldiphosphate specific] n=1 Tax=Amanita thiersii Skay4041 TaxID=703135 RepID=A0A2A9P1D1_9AGAR|nr:hypothetical protein AMATHDRAFT_134800 [Amanita thiersii Skay4041]
MSCLSSVFLFLFHQFYSLCLSLHSYSRLLMWRQPALLDAPRKRIPNHLALLLVSDSSQPSEHAQDCMLQSVQRAVGWSQQVGIRKLTVYDQHGILIRCIPQIRERLASLVPTVESSDSEIEYPLTPPSSDYADSRPLSPRAVYPHVFSMQLPRCTRNPTQRRKKVKRRRSRARKFLLPVPFRHFNHVFPFADAGNVALAPLTLCISSRDSAKPAVATAACSLLQAGKSDQLFNPQQPTSPPVSVDTLNVLLECTFLLLY